MLHVRAATDLEGLEGPQHVQGVGDLPVLGALSLCSLGCTLGLLSALPSLAAPAQGVPKVLVLICTKWNASSAVGLQQCRILSDAKICLRSEVVRTTSLGPSGNQNSPLQPSAV